MIRLRLVRQRTATYVAHLDDTLVVESHQPIYDGARRLLKLGYDPDTLMSARHETSKFDSIDPTPIRLLAKWTVVERDKGCLHLTPWRALPAELQTEAS